MMKYNNSQKDLKVRMFHSGWSDPKDLELEVNNFLKENSINIVEIVEVANKSARWLTIYYTEIEGDLDGVL